MNPQDVQTFMSITGSNEAVAIQSLTVHGGDLNTAVNSFFNEGTNVMPQDAEEPDRPQWMEEDLPSAPATLEHFVQPQPPFSLLPQHALPSPWGMSDPTLFPRSLVDWTRPLPNTSASPQVAHPPDVRDVPIEWHDEDEDVGPRRPHYPHGPVIEEVTESDDLHILDTGGRVNAPVEEAAGATPSSRPVGDLTRPRITQRFGYNVGDEDDTFNPNAPVVAEVSGINDEEFIQEQMLQAAIEASKKEAELGRQRGVPNITEVGSQAGVARGPTRTAEEDDLARAVSLSLETAKREKALRELGEASGQVFMIEDNEEEEEEENLRRLALLRGNTQDWAGSLGEAQSGRTESHPDAVPDRVLVEEIDEPEDEQPLFRRPSNRRISVSTAPSGSAALPALSVMDALAARPQQTGEDKDNTVLDAHDNIVAVTSTEQHAATAPGSSQQNGSSFPDEWGGISSEEHDEAVMLEAALFGGLPETGPLDMGLPFQQRHVDVGAVDAVTNVNMFNPRRNPQPPSPSVVAQRLIREQQDDEYLQSLAADREKELKAVQDAEDRRRQEEAAAAAAQAQENLRREEELKLHQAAEERERQLVTKKASLPQEPAAEDENAVKLLVRMPDSTRRGRRFRKSDKLQVLFDFLDCSEDVQPGTYRLVTAFPRRVFSDEEHGFTFASLGLSSKQELLNLEIMRGLESLHACKLLLYLDIPARDGSWSIPFWLKTWPKSVVFNHFVRQGFTLTRCIGPGIYGMDTLRFIIMKKA